MNLFISTLFDSPIIFGIWVVIVIFSICCHEFAHAYVAKTQGDNTAAQMGHLTLNPLKQMGGMSLIMLLFIGMAWGQVPVNPRLMRHKFSRLWVSLAGISANIILFVIFTLLLAMCNFFEIHNDIVIDFCFIGAKLNAILAMFNLLPVPPLDGFTACRELFPKLKQIDSSEIAKGTMIFLFFALFIFGFEYLNKAAYFLLEALLDFFTLIFSSLFHRG